MICKFHFIYDSDLAVGKENQKCLIVRNWIFESQACQRRKSILMSNIELSGSIDLTWSINHCGPTDKNGNNFEQDTEQISKITSFNKDEIFFFFKWNLLWEVLEAYWIVQACVD